MKKVSVYLAPMAGVSDLAMREVCITCGADLTFSEMVSAKGLAYENVRTKELLALSAREKKVGIQLFGSDEDIIAKTGQMVEEMLGERLAVLDVNMGCPAPKIVKNGDGCALMRDERKAGRIVERLKRSVSVPVSAKFRLGFDENNLNAQSFARVMQESGADRICIHGRTREQYYSGRANLDIIARIKQDVEIEVIGNGDIFSAQDAKRMIDYTGCDAIMVARGARGNPFIFEQIKALLEGRESEQVSDERRVLMCIEQARICTKNKGEELAMKQMRSHSGDYVKGIRHASSIRSKLVLVKTLSEFEEILMGLIKK